MFVQKVKDLRDLRGNGATHVDDAVPGQPQNNGVAEKAAQDLTTQLRKCKIALETRLGKPIVARSVSFRWLARHSADTINRSLVGHDGRVPLQRFRHQMHKPTDVEFGEQVWAKTPTYKNKRRVSRQERSKP